MQVKVRQDKIYKIYRIYYVKTQIYILTLKSADDILKML